MQTADFEQIAAIRAAVGYLREKDQAGWWSSSFFASTGSTFLSPVFPRTQVVAQSQSASGAAAKIHDERIGGIVWISSRFKKASRLKVPSAMFVL